MGSAVNFPKSFYQTGFVNGSDLIKNNLAGCPLKCAVDPRGIIPLSGRHGGDDDRPDELIHLIGGYDQTGARLLNFASESWVKSNEIHIKPLDGTLLLR